MSELYPLSMSDPNGWQLAPEGAAIHLGEGVAVIADVHLGYEWTRAAKGDMVPPHSLTESLAKLECLLARTAIDRLIVAGDLTESPSLCPRTARDVRRLGSWLTGRGVKLAVLPGNHDRPRGGLATLDVAGWTIGHGHEPIEGARVVMGHFHPALRAGGSTVPCFLAGPSMIVLPAFTANAAGVDSVCLDWPGDPRVEGLRCVAEAGGEWFDFGPLMTLKAGIGGQRIMM